MTHTDTNATADIIQFKHTRICQHCYGPIPHERGGKKPGHRAKVKYCSDSCGRKAMYHNKTLEERKAINKQSNDRRFEQDLLPYLRSLSRTMGDLSNNSEAIRHFALKVILIEAFTNWRLRTALGFERARDALIELAGSADTLEAIEVELMETAMELRKGK